MVSDSATSGAKRPFDAAEFCLDSRTLMPCASLQSMEPLAGLPVPVVFTRSFRRSFVLTHLDTLVPSPLLGVPREVPAFFGTVGILGSPRPVAGLPGFLLALSELIPA